MNGFEYLGAMKSHDDFKRIPVVMLTSRTASKHRKKASSLGASGFVVKPYNETEFATLIQRLLENPAMREGL
jgi:DNA-binding response OmpR family regulator